MPKNVEDFVKCVSNQMKIEYIDKEDIEIKESEGDWIVKFKTNEVGFVFSSDGQFKYIYNWKD